MLKQFALRAFKLVGQKTPTPALPHSFILLAQNKEAGEGVNFPVITAFAGMAILNFRVGTLKLYFVLSIANFPLPHFRVRVFFFDNGMDARS